jgi:hypothetical protein
MRAAEEVFKNAKFFIMKPNEKKKKGGHGHDSAKQEKKDRKKA